MLQSVADLKINVLDFRSVTLRVDIPVLPAAPSRPVAPVRPATPSWPLLPVAPVTPARPLVPAQRGSNVLTMQCFQYFQHVSYQVNISMILPIQTVLELDVCFTNWACFCGLSFKSYVATRLLNYSNICQRNTCNTNISLMKIILSNT